MILVMIFIILLFLIAIDQEIQLRKIRKKEEEYNRFEQVQNIQSGSRLFIDNKIKSISELNNLSSFIKI